jgi:hypothetical protein
MDRAQCDSISLSYFEYAAAVFFSVDTTESKKNPLSLVRQRGFSSRLASRNLKNDADQRIGFIALMWERSSSPTCSTTV